MDKAPRITQVSKTRQSRRCFRDAGRFPHRQAACRQSPVAFPSQKQRRSDSSALRTFRSGVYAGLSPRSGSPSQKQRRSDSSALRTFRSGVYAGLSPRSGSPSQKQRRSDSSALRTFRSGVYAGLSPRSGSPSQKQRRSDSSALRTFRSGVYTGLSPRSGVSAVPAPRSGSERRCIPAELPRSARLIVALRSKYTRASSPGGGSSLARLVSRAPRPHREDWPLSALTPLCPPAAGGATRWALRVTLSRGEGKLLPAPHPCGAPRRELTLADSRHRLPRTKTIANLANTKRSNAE